MLFFYKSHTPIFSYTGHFKKIYNAVKCTIPTQILKKGVQWKKYLKNKKAIGETDNSKKRAVSFASFAGSLTVEAALILPIFLSAMLLLSGLFHAMSVCSQVNHYLCMTGRKIAAYSRSEKGVDQGTLYQLFYSEIGGSGIDSDDIAGGYAGLIPRAESSEQGRLIKLSIRFGIRMPDICCCHEQFGLWKPFIYGRGQGNLRKCTAVQVNMDNQDRFMWLKMVLFIIEIYHVRILLCPFMPVRCHRFSI